jgi:basic amino acid/polyamine antiporter, APA family
LSRDVNGQAQGPQAQGLAREVGLWGAVWMGLGSILGTGVFVSLGIGAGLVGAGVVWAVAAASLVAAANGLSSAQLAAAHPVSGGTYEYGHRLISPLAGYAAGWMFLVAKSASAATAALGCAGYALDLLGVTGGGDGLRVVAALGLVAAVTALVVGGIQRSSAVNAVIVTATLAALGVFCAACWVSVGGEEVSARLGLAAVGAGIEAPSGFLRAVALLFVAYTGYGRIATMGEEVKDPARTIPKAIMGALLLAMALYGAVSSAAVVAVGAQAFAALTQRGGAPLEAIARQVGGPAVAAAVGAGAVAAMGGVLLNLLLGLSRVLLAMARRGEAPQALARVEERTHSPRRAVWVMGAVVGALTLAGDLKMTWSLSALTVLLYYGLTHVAALRLPPTQRRAPRWVAVAGLIACFGLTFWVEGRAWLIALGLMTAGLVVRAALRRANTG